jgi:tRNA(Ile)-lysidine synthetase-like protein
MPDPALIDASDSVPSGRWAIGVSGGPDSVAMLALLRTRGDLQLHVVHLDHELRGGESGGDAEFVRQLAERWQVPCTIERRSQVEAAAGELPANPSARYRRLRQSLFARVVQAQSLDGVLLAHHADDQAETVLHRLLRSSGVMGLAGMSRRTRVGGLVIQRPLLGVRGSLLREFLREIGQPWRTDSSNTSPRYLRNRLRPLLVDRPGLVKALLELSERARTLRDWVRRSAPEQEECFYVARLAELPSLLAGESARRWLAARGVPPDELGPAVLERLITMAGDAASPPRQHFPGQLLVRRRRGMIDVVPASPTR